MKTTTVKTILINRGYPVASIKTEGNEIIIKTPFNTTRKEKAYIEKVAMQFLKGKVIIVV